MAMAFTAPDDWREDDEEDWTIPARPARRGRTIGLKRLIGAALGAMAIAFVVVATRHDDPSSRPMPVPVAAPDWVVVPHAENPFPVRSGLFEGRALVHEQRRQVKGDGLEDILSSGALDTTEPYLRLTVGRDAGLPVATLFLELALQGADSQLSILRADQPFLLATRLGAFEAAPMTVTSGAATAGCLGFRSGAADGRLHISGLACGVAQGSLTGADLVCIIDGLTLAAPTEDKALADFFHTAGAAQEGACVPPHTGLSRIEAEPNNAPAKANIRFRIRKKAREAM
jgi:hypothetical protein